MLDTEILQAFGRYRFLIQLLYQCNQLTDNDFKNDNRWFAFAPKIVTKFLNQAFTLEMLFGKKELELSEQPIQQFEDLSAIYSLLRMQFETHALFYHLFMPCNDIEENILRFRLWELDGIRGRVAINKNNASQISSGLLADQFYLPIVESAITGLLYFKELDNKKQVFLLKYAAWRFSSLSLKEKHLKPISYQKLLSMTGFNPDYITDLYTHLSMHIHPSYVGVVQNFSLTKDEQTIGKYTALMFAGMVAAMMIEDFAKRFAQVGKRLNVLTTNEMLTYDSMICAARGRPIKE